MRRSFGVARRREGFTLIEVMTAMVLTGVVLVSVVALLMSQVKYVSQINGDIQALDQVNAAQGMLSTEITTLTRGAVQFAGADSVVFNLPLSWGLVCGPIDRHLKGAPPTRKTSRTGATSPTYSTTAALAIEPNASALNSPVPDGFGLSLGGSTFTYYPVATWSTMGMAQDTVASLACMRQSGSANPVKIDPKRPNRFPLSTSTIFGSIEDYSSSTGLFTVVGAMPDDRTLMLTYLRVSYFLRVDGAGVSLYRSSKAGTAKLAGPFASNVGFTYRLSDGSSSTSIAAGSLANIRAIRPNLSAIRIKRGSVRADTLNIQPWIYLFNAQ